MANLTEYETNRSINVDIKNIDVYRGNTGFTTLYMKDDSVIYVNENFDYVDEVYESEVNNG